MDGALELELEDSVLEEVAKSTDGSTSLVLEEAAAGSGGVAAKQETTDEKEGSPFAG